MKYIALTIGPIYKTLSTAKKTRELWGGSYFFSYIMREIISQFKEREFIVPYIKDEKIFNLKEGLGLFHDRFIFEAKEGDIKRVDEVVDEVLKNLADNTPMSYTFLKEYLQVHIIEKELEDEANPILELTPYLDTAELLFSVAQYQKNELNLMLKNNNSFLTKDAFGEKKPFLSLPEIAMNDLTGNFNIASMLKDDELKIFESDEFKKELKNYHKYYAIVQADGDSMGKVIEKLKGKKEFQDFSKKLFEYCLNSDALIQNYGGETIFAGGDDLLFFAPVVSGNKTVFTLCDEISQSFNTEFKGTEATLSFGVSISYYKYPLYEALEKSRSLLFEDAKSGTKNNIAFSVTKHSGQTFKSVMHKEGEVYENFKLFSSNIKGGEGMDNFLHTVHHKIDSNKIILTEISNDKLRVQSFFDNYFNEAEHKEYREFFEQLTDFIVSSKSLDDVYATLRFIKFIQGDK